MTEARPQVKIGEWITEGWRLVTGTGNFWNFVLLMLAFMAAMMVAGASGVGQLVFMGPIMCAVFAVILHLMETGKFDWNQIKASFDRFVPAMLAGLILSLFFFGAYILLLVPLFIIMIIGPAMRATSAGPGNLPEGPTDFFLSIMLPLAPFFLLFVAAVLVLATLYLFAFPLVLERKLEFWEAMETSRKTVQKNFWGFFVFNLALSGVNILGFLACGLGWLVTTPVTWCATMAAYREIWPIEVKAAEVPGMAPPPEPPAYPPAQ